MRDDIDLDVFKKRLEQRLAEITCVGGAIDPVELDQARVGRRSRMDDMQHQAMAQAAGRLAALEAQRIRTALERIATGDYGDCIRCEEDIAQARLQADPSALTCIACARSIES